MKEADPVCAVAAARPQPTRVALVVHPTRAVAEARATVERWAEQHALELVRVALDAGGDAVAPGDLVSRSAATEPCSRRCAPRQQPERRYSGSLAGASACSPRLPSN